MSDTAPTQCVLQCADMCEFDVPYHLVYTQRIDSPGLPRKGELAGGVSNE